MFQNLKKERIMNKFELQKLRDLPIEGVAEQLGLKITHFKTLCPFHNDNHPSLSIHVRRNSYKCFVCGAHGGVIDLVMQVLDKDFKEACRWLGAEDIRPSISPFKRDSSPFKGDAGETFQASRYERHFHRPYLNAEACHFLFTERRFSPAVVRWLGISSISQATPCWRYGRPYFDAPSLLIPYRAIHGHLLSVQSRYLGTSRDIPRFRFPRGSRCGIYNLPILTRLRPGEDLWITEGVTDCIAMLSSGRKAIAIPSATLLTRDDKKTLHAYATTLSTPLRLHMYPDADIPGEKLYLQLKQLFPQLVRHSLPPGIKDFAEYYIRSITNSK